MTSSEDNWEPRIAAERLASYHANVLDYVGRVDKAVVTGDMWYLVEKGEALVRAAQQLVGHAKELRAEQTPLQAHLAAIEDQLVRTGQLGYPAVAALHPVPVVRSVEPRGTLDHVAEITRGRVECLGGNVYGVIVPVATAHGPADLLITSNDDDDGYLIRACTAPTQHAEDGCRDCEFTCAEYDNSIRSAVDEALSWLARGGRHGVVPA